MKKILATALLGAAATLALASSAQAETIDWSPLINMGISEILVPLALAALPAGVAYLAVPLKRYLGQQSGAILAGRVEDVLQKAIAFGADQASKYVSAQDIHTETGSNFITNVAVDYALKHAPDLMKQAGGVLAQKVQARLACHPDVIALKADAAQAIAAAPVELHPAAAAA